MTVAWLETPGKGFAGYARQARARVLRLGHAIVQPHRAALGRLAEMPLTVIGTGCIDFAAFHYVHMVGWLVTGISLFYIERVIADPPGGGSE